MLQLGGDGNNVAVDEAAHCVDYVVVKRICHLAVPFSQSEKWNLMGARRPCGEINRTNRRAANGAYGAPQAASAKKKSGAPR
jgi:hypothetical protein